MKGGEVGYLRHSIRCKKSYEAEFRVNKEMKRENVYIAGNVSFREKTVFFLLPLLVWMTYWLAYYPALMSPDSIWQWKQMLSLELNNVHPALHTLSIWLITRLWLHPAAIALFQIAAFTLVCGWGLLVLRRVGVPRWAVWSALILLSLHPADGFMIITLWKDTLYSLFILLLTLLCLIMLREPGRIGKGSWIALGLLLAGLPLFRHNGILVTVLLVPCLLLAFRTQRPQIGKACLTALLVLLPVRGILFPLLGVAPNIRGWQPLIHQTAALLHAGVRLTPEEEDLLNSFRSTADQWAYSPYTVETTLYRGERFDFETLTRRQGEFLRFWWRNVLAHPGTLLRHQKQVTSFLWNIVPPPDRHLRTVIGEISENDLGLATDSLFPAFRRLLDRVVIVTTHRQLPFILIWRPAIYLYAVIIGLVVLALRMRSPRFLVLGAPVLGNTLSLMVSVSSAELRYQYPLLLAVPFLLAAVFMEGNTPENGGEEERTR